MTGAALGRSSDWWRNALDRRVDRMHRLIELGAPPVIVSKEIGLIRSALLALDELNGNREAAN
jgi:hypothetical protein